MAQRTGRDTFAAAGGTGMLPAMRALVISDIHSNIEALDAVLAHARGSGDFDAVWCTGDIVGYGPDPGAVIDALQRIGAVCVAGNHDLAAIGTMGTDEFNRVAAEAAEWTARTLTPAHRAMLGALPLVQTVGDVTFVHGSLRLPEWEYLLDPEQALAQFELQATPYSMVGHSHLQFWFEESEGRPPMLLEPEDGETLQLDKTRVILNAGSVGQPRDRDPRAGYMLYDDAAAAAGPVVTWHRVAYDAETTRRKIIEAGLPRMLGDRLLEGR